MTGFFQLESDSPCFRCGLKHGCHSPKMPVTGKGRMKILVVAEAPGEEEDRKGIQLIGPAGQLLRDVLSEYGIDLDRDCRKTNAVRCRPLGDRRPTRQEIAACQPHIWDEIKARPPKMILLLGQVAVESFLNGLNDAAGAIGRWRGFHIPDQRAKCWICPAYHPAYILRAKAGRAIRGKAKSFPMIEEIVFRMDIERALGMVNKKFPIAPEPKRVSDCSWLGSGKEIAIDYETTGKRPYRKGHEIISFGISDGEVAAAFLMNKKYTLFLKALLKKESIKKIGHNIKFEHQWASSRLDTETKGWIWDSMVAAHVIDNRWHICGLKHQAYLMLGVEDWSKEVKDDLRSHDKEHGVNAFNSLKGKEASPLLLKYNALDAFWTWHLAKRQMEMIK